MSTPTPPDTPDDWGTNESILWRSGWTAGWEARRNWHNTTCPDGLISTLGPNAELFLTHTTHGYLIAGHVPHADGRSNQAIADTVIGFATNPTIGGSSDNISNLSDTDSIHLTTVDRSTAAMLWAGLTRIVTDATTEAGS